LQSPDVHRNATALPAAAQADLSNNFNYLPIEAADPKQGRFSPHIAVANSAKCF
jgi:hypothetical protein